MNRIAERALIALGGLCIAAAASALDTGIILGATGDAWSNDITDIDNIEDIEAEATGSVTANMKIPLGKSGKHRIAAEGNFVYKVDNDASGDSSELKTADLTLLKYAGNFDAGNGQLALSLGRFFIEDATSVVLSQTADGAMIQYLSSAVNVSVYGGYTGLLNAQNVTELDGEDSDFAYDDESLYDWASSYVLASAAVSFPYLILNQTISLEGVAAIGVNGANSDNSGYYRAYGTFALNGPLASKLFYRASTTFCKEKDNDIANLSMLSLELYPGYKGISLLLSGLWASADNGDWGAFKGITSQKATLAYDEPQYSALAKAGGSVSIKPVDAVLLRLGGDAVFTYLDEDLQAVDELEFSGYQVYGGIVWQVFTDCKASLSASDYVGKNDATNKLAVSAGLTLAF